MSVSTQSAFFNSIQANFIVGHPVLKSSPVHLDGVLIQSPSVTNLTATGAVTAASILGGLLKAAPTANPSTYTLPTAADLIAAFATANMPLAVGDMFTVNVQNTGAANGALFAVGVGITAGNAIETIPARKSAVLTFRVTNITAGAQAITLYSAVSA